MKSYHTLQNTKYKIQNRKWRPRLLTDTVWHLILCTVLYCIVLYCIVLYCIVLYCIVLYCIVLYMAYTEYRLFSSHASTYKNHKKTNSEYEIQKNNSYHQCWNRKHPHQHEKNPLISRNISSPWIFPFSRIWSGIRVGMIFVTEESKKSKYRM